MKYLILICCFFCLQQDEVIIPWTSSYKLTWQDFKGKPNYNTRPAATTASGISFGFSIKQRNKKDVGFSTDIHTNFYPNKSWYKKEEATNHILNHEQVHFDITELFARKLRQRLEQVKPQKNTKKVLNNIYAQILKNLREKQLLYDSETDHSINIESQNRWNIYVKEELNKLEKYKSTAVK